MFIAFLFLVLTIAACWRTRTVVQRAANERLGRQKAMHLRDLENWTIYHAHEMSHMQSAACADALTLSRASEVIEAWKTYALGYEVFCEAAADGEAAGVENAQAVIVSARDSLRVLGEYDA